MPVITTRSDMTPVRYHAVRVVQQCRPRSSCSNCSRRSSLVAAQTPPPTDLVRSALRSDAREAAVHPLHPRPLHGDDDVQPAREAAGVARNRDCGAALARADDLHGSRAPDDRHRRQVARRRRGRIARERETIDISQTQKRIDQYFTQATIGQLRSMFDITVRARSRRFAAPIASTCARSGSRSKKGSSGSRSGSIARRC